MQTRLRELEAELETLRRELQAAHEKQRAGDEVFRRFSDSGILGIAMFELSGKILFANEALLKLIGCHAEDAAAGQVWWDEFTPPEWTSRAAAAIEELKTHGSCAPHEREYVRRDGTRFWGLFTGVVMAGQNAVAFLLDITERKQAEQALRFQARLLDAVEQAVVATDLDGAITYWNRFAERLYGWSADEVIGRCVLDVIPAETGRKSAAALLARLRTGESWSGELLVRRKDGSGFPAWVTDSPIYDSAGALVGNVGISSDMTDRKATLAREQEARARAEEADRHKDQFLAMLAHELRNPLGAISNAVQVVGRAAPGSSAFERARQVVERQSRHMARLVDELLDVSRISRGKIELNPQRLDLAALVRDTSEDHRRVLEAAGLSLTLELPEAPLWVDGDPTRLAQVLGNLLTNAAKFTPPGGQVTVRAGARGRRGDGATGRPDSVKDRPVLDLAGPPLAPSPPRPLASVTVTDTGIGISPELLPRLFEPFVQADRSLDRTQGGLGLGLALVKGIIELHGGRVDVRSDGIGRGATFTVEIPLQK
jgi:PAS domain S-box-containing protein